MAYTKKVVALVISFLLVMSVFPFSASALTFSDGTFKYMAVCLVLAMCLLVCGKREERSF